MFNVPFLSSVTYGPFYYHRLFQGTLAVEWWTK